MSRQKILLIVTSVLSFVLLMVCISLLTPESKNYKTYTKALGMYNSNNFSDAYYSFGKVSRFSRLKSAAIFRQAMCSGKLGDAKTELKKYKEVIWYYPNSALGIRAKYLKAQGIYQGNDFKKAEKEFKNILLQYPNTDYALGAQYYLGTIELEKASKTNNLKRKTRMQNKALHYFKTYLKAAPTGRFAVYCANKWAYMGRKLTNEDNLLIAKIYQVNGNYREAQRYLKSTNIEVSWPYFVKNAYELKNYSKVRYYTVLGLTGKGFGDVFINESTNENDEKKAIYEAIDDYLAVSPDPVTSISYLLSISTNKKSKDYLFYKNCNNLPISSQTACFNTLYYKYPNGQFSAEALSNIVYDKVKSQKYFMAKKLGKAHLAKFSQTNSAPKVMFWLAKTAERTKNYEEARSYYRTLLRQYPDDYYAYHAFLNLNRFRRFKSIGLQQKQIEFPYRHSGYGLVTELAKVKDYGLINQLCKDDEFIQSWLFNLQGNFSNSARIARDAIDKLSVKPDRFDPRWRLAYPVHYYNDILPDARARNNDPVLILAIMREESYFNTNAQSAAGARGLMQLMPATAREAASSAGISLPNENLLFDPYINIKLGNIYYSKLKGSLSDKDILAVMAYNGGIGSVSKWRNSLNYYDTDDFIEQIPYAETQNYLKKVFKSYWNYLRIYDAVRF